MNRKVFGESFLYWVDFTLIEGICFSDLNLSKIVKNNFLVILVFVAEKLCLINSHFTRVSGHFFSNYINVLHKTDIQTRCVMCLNLNWIKRHNIGCNIFLHAWKCIILGQVRDIEFSNSPILQFLNLKCCIKAKEPLEPPF